MPLDRMLSLCCDFSCDMCDAGLEAYKCVVIPDWMFVALDRVLRLTCDVGWIIMMSDGMCILVRRSQLGLL